MKLLASPHVSKLSLAFILHHNEPVEELEDFLKTTELDCTTNVQRHVHGSHKTKNILGNGVWKPRTRRKAPPCSVAGCPNYTIDRGLCFRHGGGRTCSVENCATSAKHRGLCWKHGGSMSCSVDGCTRGAKSKALCWSHGGANNCTFDGCTKMAISKGHCWSHGGGRRCSFESCKRPASTKTGNVCTVHVGVPIP